MAKKDIREELLTATGIEQEEGESEQALAERVATYISDEMDETAYGELSPGATTWYEKALATLEAEEELLLPGAKATPAAAKKAAPAAKKAAGKKAAVVEEEAEEEAEEEPAPAPKKGSKAKAVKEEAPAAKKAAKVEKEEKAPRNSSTSAIIAAMCKSPNATKEKLTEQLAAKGIDLSGHGGTYRTTRVTIDTLKAMGKL